MSGPPIYECPVCKNKLQRGHLGKHLARHSQEELRDHIINADEVDELSWHPALNCSSHIYMVCPLSKDGFEKGMRLHKNHKCNYRYKEWYKKKVELIEAEVMQAKEEAEHPEATTQTEINVIIEPVMCKCSIELEKLKKELEQFKQWRDLILSSVPKSLHQEEPQKEEATHEESTLEEPVHEQPKPPVKKTKPKIQAVKVPVSKIHASKKEIEKGMWCKSCYECGTVAQYTTDLKTCCNCKQQTHFNDDLIGCYHWDCSVCKKQSCYSCVKHAGGNKLHPLCSQECAKIYKHK
jgi:hypothetical protein